MGDIEENLGSAKQISGYVDDGAGLAYQRIHLTPEAKRENVRGLLAGSLVLLLAVVIVASFAQQWIHPDRDKELHEWMNSSSVLSSPSWGRPLASTSGQTPPAGTD